ncbi:hypothetical protein [uncultured Winogradskyella sp.]|uniref:hypothetical protein n=1 Tax=uncultured Winogradskyella sp. TaxID=395353 RepID=UPI002603C821|nr:hypothetical protein [uncultured Winogradskyella sp.]
MSYKNYFFSIVFILFALVGSAQQAVLCPLQKDYIKIENSDNIPTVTNNSDGTITLTHQDQTITDIFANYIIYDFYQAFPNSTGVLFEYYDIVHKNKDLINELYNTVSSDVFFIEYEYDFTPVSSNMIALLDGKTYKLSKFCSDIPEVGESCINNEQSVPDGFELKIEFNYDQNEDMIFAETVNISPCGNVFSIGLKGGVDECCYPVDIALQLWETDLGISTETDYDSGPCHSIEQWLYSMLDIGCQVYNIGNIKIYPGDESGEIIIERETGVFSTDFMKFQEDNLSVDEFSSDSIRFLKAMTI